MSLIDHEIEEVKNNCENVVQSAKIIACLSTLVRIDLKNTPQRQLTACIRFPANYPTEILLIELKSKTLSEKLLAGVTTICEQRLKQLLGRPQIIETCKFISNYLEENPLCVVFDEIGAIKKQLGNEGELKLKQKQSLVVLTARGGNYYFKTKVEVPKDYPNQCVKWDAYESNLPGVLLRFLNGQAKEIARQCVEPPLSKPNAPFEPRPSFQRVLTFILEATRDFHAECCPVCDQRCLIESPNETVLCESDDKFLERTYCGHIYHQACLKKYMREPPFPPGGKLCPAITKHLRSDSRDANKRQRKVIAEAAQRQQQHRCGVRIAHDKWGLNVNLAEARWAQQEARKRELEEVIDFLQ